MRTSSPGAREGKEIDRSLRTFAVTIGFFLLGACGEGPGRPPDPGVLVQADRDFAAAVAEGGSEAWASWFAEDGAMMREGQGEIRGRSEIRAAVGSLDRAGVSLRWEPLRADIAESGDLGWTTGTYVSEAPGADGGVVRAEGRYVSIWRIQADGAWRVVMDLGTPTETPTEGEGG